MNRYEIAFFHLNELKEKFNTVPSWAKAEEMEKSYSLSNLWNMPKDSKRKNSGLDKTIMSLLIKHRRQPK